MKLAILLLMAAAVGGGIGVATAYVTVGPPVELLPVSTTEGGVTRLGPRPVVDEPVHNFGAMQRGSTRKHTFVIKNEGDKPFQVQIGATSCKCTLGDVDGAPVPPGGRTTATLEWVAKTLPGEFRQTATLNVSPPVRSGDITLTVEGKVVEATGLVPQEFNLGRTGVDQPRELSVVLLAFDQEDLTVTAEPPSREGTEGLYELSVEPVTEGDLPDDRAKAGVRITLNVAPGLPVGSVDDWVTLKTNLPSAPELLVPIFGRVEGDLSVHGAGWSADKGILALGYVKSQRGKKTRLFVSAKGPRAKAAGLAVAEVDPPELKVTLGEPRNVSDDNVKIPLTVEVPPGTRQMVRLNNGRRPDGTYQFPEGRILLTSKLPNTPEVQLRVRFAVVDGER